MAIIQETTDKIFGKSDRQLIVSKVIMNKSFLAGKMGFGLFGLIRILGVNKKSSSKEIMTSV